MLHNRMTISRSPSFVLITLLALEAAVLGLGFWDGFRVAETGLKLSVLERMTLTSPDFVFQVLGT